MQRVQHVDGGARVVEGAVRRGGRGPNSRASAASRTLGASSRVSTRRARRTVHSTGGRGHGMSARSAAAPKEPDVEAGVVRDEHRAAGELQERRQHRRDAWAHRSTIAVVMPVSGTICGGMARPGSTRVANSPSTSPPRTLTAPISVMASRPSPLARPPVVSRSTTTNVVSRRDT